MLSALFWSRLPFQVPCHKSPSAQIFAGIRAFWFIPQLISRAHHFLTYPLLCDSAHISPTPAFPLAFSISAQCLEAALTCCPRTQTWPGCAAKGLAHHTVPVSLQMLTATRNVWASDFILLHQKGITEIWSTL